MATKTNLGIDMGLHLCISVEAVKGSRRWEFRRKIGGLRIRGFGWGGISEIRGWRCKLLEGV